MRYLSVCSGVEAASVAWHDLGWTPVGFSEIEPFPSAVLAHRFPQVKNYGDLTRYKEWDIEPGTVDLLVGGTPCQSFSVAGLRKGLEDPRGNLALVFLGLADHLRVPWVVWENVPGVLSSSGGRDFGSFLGALEQLGYRWSYRTLDAQYFGVPQRRRRVFVVAHLGNGPHPASVLFESASLRGDTAKGGKARKGAPRGAGKGAASGREPSRINCQPDGIAGTVSVKWVKGSGGPAGDEHYNMVVQPLVTDARGLGDGLAAPTLQPTLTMAVRRLLPVECERLQGFPEVTESVRLSVCFVPAENCARVEISSRKKHIFAWSADDAESMPSAPTAGEPSLTHLAVPEPLAVVRVDSGFGVSVAVPRKTEKSSLSVPNAERSSAFLQAIQPDDTARQLARLAHELVNAAGHGRAESLQFNASSSAEKSGKPPAAPYGRDTVDFVADVVFDQNLDTFTTSALGNLIPRTASPLATWCCSALRAIAGFIPAATLPESFSVEWVVTTPWTDIPWRGKPAPDGPRYKAMGNSMAVPVMRWIGERLDQVAKGKP